MVTAAFFFPTFFAIKERKLGMSGGGGRNRTHRTGFARPTRVEDEGGHQTSFTSAGILSGIQSSEHSQAEKRSP